MRGCEKIGRQVARHRGTRCGSNVPTVPRAPKRALTRRHRSRVHTRRLYLAFTRRGRAALRGNAGSTLRRSRTTCRWPTDARAPTCGSPRRDPLCWAACWDWCAIGRSLSAWGCWRRSLLSASCLGLTLLSGGRSDGRAAVPAAQGARPPRSGQLTPRHAELATELRNQPDATFAERGGALYVLGSILAREAEEQPNPTQRRLLYLVASRYLEDAQTHGFPPESRGRWPAHARPGPAPQRPLRLGAAGPPRVARTPVRTRPPNSIACWPTATCSLTPPRLAAALEHARAYLAIAGPIARERHPGMAAAKPDPAGQGNQPAASDESLAQIPDDSPLAAEAIMQRARVAIEAARRERKAASTVSDATAQSLTRPSPPCGPRRPAGHRPRAHPAGPVADRPML